jgi:hypothetical protein
MTKASLLAAIVLIGGACASAPHSEPATASLIEAEREFAANGSRMTVNAAFLEVLRPDAILFRQTPVNGRASLAERPMRNSLLLLWQPMHAETSYDGTLGVTTGPSEYGERPSARAGTGHFLSVWRATGTGWGLAMDAGIESPLKTSVAGAIRVLTTRNGTRDYPDDGGLADVENTLITDYRNRFEDLADEDVRVYRNGTIPTTSKREALALIARDSSARYVPANVIVAGSNDLAYVYGTINPGSPNAGGYIRVYRRGPRRVWKIAYDWRS